MRNVFVTLTLLRITNLRKTTTYRILRFYVWKYILSPLKF